VGMTPAEFARKWMGSTQAERAAAQEHFIDLCRMLGVPTPNEADPTGRDYAFEKGAEKVGGGDGFADVWKRGHFAWEYKGKRKDLKAAYQQLLQYREALENPPLLVVCDLDRFEVHTNFTNTPTVVHAFTLRDLLEHPEEPLRVLRAVMAAPDALRPGKTREELTSEAAEQFASLALALRGRGHDPQRVAHFLNKLLFCMFAQDASLLPAGLLERLAEGSRNNVDVFTLGLHDLFATMSQGGGLFGTEPIDWFNGGLFDGADVLPLTVVEIGLVQRVSRLDWSQVEPAVFGTLFERGLDPGKRAQLGAHYTDRASIMRVVDPVLMAPLRRDFEATRQRVQALLGEGRRITARTPPDRNPHAVFNAFLARLRAVRVLDPACGSGNFLYLALQALKDLEREAILWASLTFQMPMEFPRGGTRVRAWDRAEQLRRRAGAGGDLDWRDPVDAGQRLLLPARPDPPPARQHRVPRRDPRHERPRGPAGAELACGRRDHRQPAVPGRQAATQRPRQRLRGGAVSRLSRSGARRGGPGLLLAREGPRHGRQRHGRAGGPARDPGHPRRGQPARAGADQGHRRHLPGLVRRALGGRGRRGARLDHRLRRQLGAKPYARRPAGHQHKRQPHRWPGPHPGAAAAGEPRHRLHGRHQRRPVRHPRDPGTGDTGQPQRRQPQQRRGGAALGQRPRRDPPAARHGSSTSAPACPSTRQPSTSSRSST
jgi:hypothetical protein